MHLPIAGSGFENDTPDPESSGDEIAIQDQLGPGAEIRPARGFATPRLAPGGITLATSRCQRERDRGDCDEQHDELHSGVLSGRTDVDHGAAPHNAGRYARHSTPFPTQWYEKLAVS